MNVWTWNEVDERALEIASQVGKRWQGRQIYVYGVSVDGIHVAQAVCRAFAWYSDRKQVEACMTNDLHKAQLIITVGENHTVHSHNALEVRFDPPARENVDRWPWTSVVEQPQSADPHSAIVTLLRYIGEEDSREGLLDTPARVVRSYAELFAGYKQDPEDCFKTFESPGCNSMVLLQGVEFCSTCEHHMLPFVGSAHIAYIPDGKVIGISKLARLLDVFARRLQIQERIGEQVTDALMEHLQPKGAACVIEAKHYCLAGDSRVQLAFLDRTKHPDGVPIKELVGRRNLPVYCYSRKRKRIEIGNISNVWHVGTKKVFRVTYEWFMRNQYQQVRKEGSIKVTEDHPFMLRLKKYNHYNNKDRDYYDGQYLSIAGGLTVGDSLMPFTCAGEPYRILHLNNGESVQEHRFLYEHAIDARLEFNDVAHHRNEVTLDNSYDNLGLLPRGEHNTHHFLGKQRPTGLPAWNRASEDEKVIVCQNCGGVSEVSHRYMTKTRKYCSRECAHEARFANHRIIKIEELGIEDVFDLEVPRYHNFAVNDVIVHNCMICRGVQKQHSVMKTSSLRGVFLDDPAVREEFMLSIK